MPHSPPVDRVSPDESTRRLRVTRALVTASIVSFVVAWWLRVLGVTFVNATWGMVPARLSADPVGEAHKLLTLLFLHDGFGHLAWNLIFLLLFGPRLERTLGGSKYLAFYLLTGVLSSLAQFGIDPHSSIPLVGASGAIAGLLGGFLVLFAKEPITIFRIRAYNLIGLWFLLNLIGGLADLASPASDTAFFAHLGGFAAGLLLIRAFISVSKDEGGFPSFTEPPRVVRPPIFPKDADGPFWRS